MKFSRLASTALLSGILLVSACRHKHRQVHTARQPRPQQQAVPVGSTEEGLASWYGVPYHGRPAADGEIYNMETLVAAHRTMPFNTWLKVTNLNNGLSVTVRVIDRGPFVNNRIIDLSKAAARQIQMIGPGIARVHLEVISAPIDVPANDFYGVQVGAFASYQSAERLRAKFAARFGAAQLSYKQGRVPLYRVLVGKAPSPAAAQQIADQLQGEMGPVFVVRLDAREQPPAPPPTASDSAPSSTPALNPSLNP
jgi:rare lipoprotein A